MWDPLLNEFPESVHGFRCMLAIKYLQSVEETYEPNTLGHDLIRDLISVVRARDCVALPVPLGPHEFLEVL